MRIYRGIGIMSGTSLDGVDIAFCEFSFENEKWKYQIHSAETIAYTSHWKMKLVSAPHLTGLELSKLNTEYGLFLGKLVMDFIKTHNCTPDFIASHGHTVFHRPETGLTLQIGNGAAIAAQTNITVINDFRSEDIALGGQGAPLVPIGDTLLFGNFGFCLNIGGFANISFEENRKRIAFDICPANIALNHFANLSGVDFDEDGKIAAAGYTNQALLDKLNDLNFYTSDPPKSLGREWFEKELLPVINEMNLSIPDVLSTLSEHIAFQIGKSVSGQPGGTMLITGGGAENNYFIERLRQNTKHQIVIPGKKLVHFKEALVFAFLGLLRIQEIPNCLASVTGAKRDHCGGAIYKT
ncbi:MAG: anhydro-N-acetylmuramic acid kinase [Bacteroidales bacterium]|nr:anhydro-N-acetylmuramic acid kinase [Bacteroidales bacterium]